MVTNGLATEFDGAIPGAGLEPVREQGPGLVSHCTKLASKLRAILTSNWPWHPAGDRCQTSVSPFMAPPVDRSNSQTTI